MTDYIYSPANFERDKALLNYVDTLQVKEHYVKIHIFNPHTGEDIGDIEGVVTQGSISVNGNSAIRRSGSLTLVVPDEKIFGLQFGGKTIHKVTDLKNLIAINKRARIYVGYSNTGYQYTNYSMFWFPLGTFSLQNPSVTYSNSGVQVQVKLSDLMTKLNGTDGGDLQMAIIHSPIVKYDGKDEEVLFKKLVETLVADFGGFTEDEMVIDIPETLDEQIYRWVGDTNLYAMFTIEDRGDKQVKHVTFTTTKPEGVYQVFKSQDPIGFKSGEAFTYPDKLSSNPGESIVSVLDKIKKTLGNYEYFFDIDGKFHFQPINNGLNDGVAPDELSTAIQEKYFGKPISKAVYELPDGILVSSYSNTPKFDMLKNDLVVWGKNGNTKLGIRYHLLIDAAPSQDRYKPYYCQFYMDDFGVQRILTANLNPGVAYDKEVTPKDWRQVLYLEAIAKQNNNQGLTALEKEIVEEWPKIYAVTGDAEFFYDANPVALNYWLDMIDVNTLSSINNETLIKDMAITEIGDRSKTYADDKLNCLFAPSAATIRLFDSEPSEEEIAKLQKYAVVTPDDPIYQDLAKGTSHNPASEYIRSVLHEHIGANNSISLQTMPLYHLEPNMRIKVENDEADIHGEYIINSLTMPLTVNGMMTIQASKAVERI